MSKLENCDLCCRDRIINAAIDCFAVHGFHGASVARIGRKAGVSPGHIYYYFKNKEALVKAIVETELERRFSIIARVRGSEDGLTSLLTHIADAVRQYLDGSFPRLWLEILAEGARNEDVAQIIADADSASRRELEAMFGDLGRQLGQSNSGPEIAASAEVFMAIFDGLMSRSIRNPQMNSEALATYVIRAVRGLFEDRKAIVTTG